LLGFVLIEQRIVSEAQIISRLAVSGVELEGFFELLRGLLVVVFILIIGDALVESLFGRLGPAARDQNLDIDRGLRARKHRLFARTVGLEPLMHALDGMLAGREARQHEWLALGDDSHRFAVHEHLGVIHVDGDRHGSELRRGSGGRIHIGGDERKPHVLVVTAAVGGGILRAFGGFANLSMHILGQFVGGYDAVVRRGVGLAFQTLDHIVSEDAVAAFELGRFVATFAIAAGGQREQRLGEVSEPMIQALGIFGRNGAAVAGIGQQDLPLGVNLAADGGAQFVHGIAGAFDIGRIEVG
jgi:hypothetical protein